MPNHRIPTRPPRGTPGALERVTDADRLRSFLGDAAHVTGHTPALVAPANESDVAEAIRNSAAVLAVGAQSSLTGGATPRGETVLSTARLNRILSIDADRVRVQAGVSLAELDAALARTGKYYPPAPTFTGAFVGGTVSTNAAGAATFKYGTTRDWVESITVVLANGDVVDLTRGQVRAHADGWFELASGPDAVRVPVPTYRRPRVPKVSAGYFAAPEMDAIDLFIGAEGTLGVIVEVTLRVLPERPACCLAFVPLSSRHSAMKLARALRESARATWRSNDPRGLDVSAIEHMDARCLAVAREDGLDTKTGVTWPDGTAMALLVTLELPPGMTSERAFDEIGRARDAGAGETPLTRFCRLLDEAGALDDVQMAVPGDGRRMAQLVALREEVPASINQRIGRAKQTVDPRIEKTAADMIVPFDDVERLMERYDETFRRRGLDVAIWGHISDGNLHPNVLPRSWRDVEAGREAILELGRDVIRMGGSPLAEHGVGRSPLKQQLLVELYGDAGVEEMRCVKRALDPDWKLAPGVLFSRSAETSG